MMPIKYCLPLFAACQVLLIKLKLIYVRNLHNMLIMSVCLCVWVCVHVCRVLPTIIGDDRMQPVVGTNQPQLKSS